MITIREIDGQHKSDARIPNDSFPLFGRIAPSYRDGKWDYELIRYAPEDVSEMCFPDEGYDPDSMPDSIFLGAYDDESCVGLILLQPGNFRYMYVADLKVKHEYRRQHIGRMLIDKARKTSAQHGYRGLYLQCQDNNPGAFLFYINSGFYIGGLDTNIYRHTKQEGKADILLYCENDERP
ncbi:MAG: GNAT family N-acetyltransferase [Clostridia bacterium]|nr:GNAT family N-acetyltransferase [Clostridia bacterium]